MMRSTNLGSCMKQDLAQLLSGTTVCLFYARSGVGNRLRTA